MKESSNLDLINNIRSIKAGVKRSFVITDANQVYAWGTTDFGKKINYPQHIEQLDGYFINQICVGFKHNWYISMDKEGNLQTILCSGDNK